MVLRHPIRPPKIESRRRRQSPPPFVVEQERPLSRREKKAASKAERISVARLAKTEQPKVDAWDKRLDATICDAKYVRKRKGGCKGQGQWVVYVSTCPRLSDLAHSIGSALSGSYVVHVNSVAPQQCASCLALDAGRARRCPEHARKRVTSWTAPTKGAFDVYASPYSGPCCWPPCPACGCPDGHARESELLVVEGVGSVRQSEVTRYRLYSRFAEEGRLPTPRDIRKRLSRAASSWTTSNAEIDRVTCDADVACLDSMLEALPQSILSPELARELAAVYRSIRRRGQCKAAHCRATPAPTPAEAPLPAPKSSFESLDIPEGKPPSLVGDPTTKLLLQFATLRSELRRTLTYFDDVEHGVVVERLRELVSDWKAHGFADLDTAFIRARKRLIALEKERLEEILLE